MSSLIWIQTVCDTLNVVLTEFFEKVDFEKKIIAQQKSMQIIEHAKSDVIKV